MLNKLDIGDLFYEQNYCDLKETETKLYELCALQWKESLTTFPKLRTYIKHKVKYKKESYLTCNLSKSRRSLLAQFRLGMLPLAIETGRYTGKSIELRVCVVCDSNEIENELHFICQCSSYNELRKELYDFIDVTIQDINFYTLGYEDKLCLIMSNQHITYKLAWFVQTAWNERQNILYNK